MDLTAYCKQKLFPLRNPQFLRFFFIFAGAGSLVPTGIPGVFDIAENFTITGGTGVLPTLKDGERSVGR